MAGSSRQDVRDFLQEVKDIITSKPGWQTWDIVGREKNKHFIAELGFIYPDVRNTILDLSVGDYCEGPIEDFGQPGYFWVFGKVIAGREAYIKLKVAGIGNLKKVRVVSFHEADQPLCYPFK